MAGRLANKVALITGAASGIGRATVERFVAEGARVLAADVQDTKGEALAARYPDRVVYRRVDVAEEAAVKGAVEAAVARFGRLDCLFNNAGFGGVSGPLDELDMAAYDRTMAVLLRGVFLGFKYAVPVMKAQGGGVILSTASVAGLQAGFGPYVYSAAKAAVVQLTRVAGHDLAKHKIRVNCICPGAIATAIFPTSLGLEGDAADQAVAALPELFAELQPLPRGGEPTDIAEAAVYLASDMAGFVTGHALVVDGGLTTGPMGRDYASPFADVLARVFDMPGGKKEKA